MLNTSRSRLMFYVLASFVMGIACAVLVPVIAANIADRVLPLGKEEIARTTSPDGKVDAVMIRDNCGAPCSFGYSVFIVPRGQGAATDLKQNVFTADDMVGERLVWKQQHLVAVGYDRARIYNFRNFFYPFRGEKNWSYQVEIQLAPSSAFATLKHKDVQ
jgi:hypothetical protein